MLAQPLADLLALRDVEPRQASELSRRSLGHLVKDRRRVAQGWHVDGDAKAVHPQGELPRVPVDAAQPERRQLVPDAPLHLHIGAAVLAELSPLIGKIGRLVEGSILARDAEQFDQRLASRVLLDLQTQHGTAFLKAVGYASHPRHGCGAMPSVQRDERIPAGALKHRDLERRVVRDHLGRVAQQMDCHRVGLDARVLVLGIHPQVHGRSLHVRRDAHHEHLGGRIAAVAIRADLGEIGA